MMRSGGGALAAGAAGIEEDIEIELNTRTGLLRVSTIAREASPIKIVANPDDVAESRPDPVSSAKTTRTEAAQATLDRWHPEGPEPAVGGTRCRRRAMTLRPGTTKCKLGRKQVESAWKQQQKAALSFGHVSTKT